jgi:hypothetical protein
MFDGQEGSARLTCDSVNLMMEEWLSVAAGECWPLDATVSHPAV